ncbi:hypothetical protein Tco_0703485 [Tanacetum coccineum]|uniref:Uncharacterized protein n=1 Tax=Tanacetum coccineum TaxID=301880 RepID=A0ABQ4XYY3_9ASTR
MLIQNKFNKVRYLSWAGCLGGLVGLGRRGGEIGVGWGLAVRGSVLNVLGDGGLGHWTLVVVGDLWLLLIMALFLVCLFFPDILVGPGSPFRLVYWGHDTLLVSCFGVRAGRVNNWWACWCGGCWGVRAWGSHGRWPPWKLVRNTSLVYEMGKNGRMKSLLLLGSDEDERIIKDVNRSSWYKEDDRKEIQTDTSQDDNTDSEKENDELRLCLTIASDEDKEVDYEILDKKRNNILLRKESTGANEILLFRELNLESEEEGHTMAIGVRVIRFVKKLIAELDTYKNLLGNEKRKDL